MFEKIPSSELGFLRQLTLTPFWGPRDSISLDIPLDLRGFPEFWSRDLHAKNLDVLYVLVQWKSTVVSFPYTSLCVSPATDLQSSYRKNLRFFVGTNTARNTWIQATALHEEEATSAKSPHLRWQHVMCIWIFKRKSCVQIGSCYLLALYRRFTCIFDGKIDANCLRMSTHQSDQGL